MGYTTKFTGAIKLGRALTIAEAKTLLELNESDDAVATTGIRAYFQWVPSQALDQIVWDGNEKFYEYFSQMVWLCGWLTERGISANGTIFWSGESAEDTGLIRVIDNIATEHPNSSEKPAAGTPLTLRALEKMALDQLTN